MSLAIPGGLQNRWKWLWTGKQKLHQPAGCIINVNEQLCRLGHNPRTCLRTVSLARYRPWISASFSQAKVGPKNQFFCFWKRKTTDTVNFFGYHHITRLKVGDHAEKLRSVSPGNRCFFPINTGDIKTTGNGRFFDVSWRVKELSMAGMNSVRYRTRSELHSGQLCRHGDNSCDVLKIWTVPAYYPCVAGSLLVICFRRGKRPVE